LRKDDTVRDYWRKTGQDDPTTYAVTGALVVSLAIGWMTYQTVLPEGVQLGFNPEQLMPEVLIAASVCLGGIIAYLIIYGLLKTLAEKRP
jgi:hypothetical protein